MQSENDSFKYTMLEQGIQYNEQGQCWDIKYRFLRPLEESFMDNWKQNMIMHEKLERRLIKGNQQ